MSDEEVFEIKEAKRHAVPMIIALSGISGAGKTYSALLLASGLAGPGAKIGFLDTENGRGCMYADSPGIMKAIPQGYKTIELAPPFHPHRYIGAIDAFETQGYKALVIDSASHAWSGEGGCCDISDKDKGRWNKAKLANKRLVNRLLFSSMHIIVCLRAQEKSKIVKFPSGKEEVISLGILPISEKSLPFEFLLSFFMDEQTKFATPIKCPEMLASIFKTPRMLTKDDGAAITHWNETGEVTDGSDRLIKRSRFAAEQGVIKYREFFSGLTPAQRKAIASIHEANKQIAEEVDRIPVFGSKDEPVEWPTEFDGPQLIWNGKLCRLDTDTGEYRESQPQAMAS